MWEPLWKNKKRRLEGTSEGEICEEKDRKVVGPDHRGKIVHNVTSIVWFEGAGLILQRLNAEGSSSSLAQEFYDLLSRPGAANHFFKRTYEEKGYLS